MSEVIQSQPINDIPEFLKEAPNFTKPNEEEKHHEKLIEIANGMDEKDAEVISLALVRKYPLILLSAIATEINDLKILESNLIGMSQSFKDRSIIRSGNVDPE